MFYIFLWIIHDENLIMSVGHTFIWAYFSICLYFALSYIAPITTCVLIGLHFHVFVSNGIFYLNLLIVSELNIQSWIENIESFLYWLQQMHLVPGNPKGQDFLESRK